MRKAVGFMFLLLANLNLLAHAAIPHHHHNKIPVALVAANDLYSHSNDGASNSQSEERDHSQPTEANHAHTADSDLFVNCLLSQAYLHALLQSQPERSISVVMLPDMVAFTSGDTLTDLTPHSNWTFRPNPYKESCYTNLVRASIGLRAPPAC